MQELYYVIEVELALISFDNVNLDVQYIFYNL